MKFWHIVLAIIVVGLLAYGAFALLFATRIGAIDPTTPVIGPLTEPLLPNQNKILVIGAPSAEIKNVLLTNKNTFGNPTIVPTNSFQANIENKIDQADIIILDQAQETSKEISALLGSALPNYVKTGGKLVIIQDSGTTRPESTEWGWKLNFGNVVPIDCMSNSDGQPACNKPIIVVGILWQKDDKHPIMQGIERVPAQPEAGYLALSIFDVSTTGNEIAYIEDVKTGKKFPAIVEQTFLGGGKTIYFNYNPGITARILENTIKYLK
jgi:hypothetical protein